MNAVLTFKIRRAENKARDREEKENSLRLYNTLISSLSHELRTPISAMIGALDTLKENKDTLSAENQTELFAVLENASIRLNRQVDNLLNMSRLESGMLKLNIDWCDLGELIHGVIQKFSQSGKVNIEFHPGENLPFFRLDAGLIEQVVYNLVHNAFQYTPEHTTIKIEVCHRLMPVF